MRARNPFIRLVHPVDNPLERQASEEFAARLGIDVETVGPKKEQAYEQRAVPSTADVDLAGLLQIMRDKSQDVEARIAAAEAALRIMDAQSLTVNITNYDSPCSSGDTAA
jgi:hypothetical protein